MIRHRLRPSDDTMRRTLFVLLALAATALAIVGCSQDDRSPAATPSSPEVQGLAVGTGAPAPGPTPATRRPSPIAVVNPTDDITASVLILADKGGVIDAGRHRLIIPPDALLKDTIITLKDISGSAGYVVCQALPEGLQFQRPVQLVTRFSDLKSPVDCTIYWIANPGQPNEDWIDMGAGPTGDADGLTTWLTHFSHYAPGKAGWGPRSRGNRGLRAGG